MVMVNRLTDSQFLIAVGLLSALLFAAAFWTVEGLRQAGFYGPVPLWDQDVVHYQRWGDAIVRGQVPYRDFDMPYPPFALPVFVLPSIMREPLGDLDGYAKAFERVMLWSGQAAALLAVFISSRLGFTRERVLMAAAFVSVSPVLLGPVMLLRYDLWPAALATASVAAAVAGRDRVASVALGFAAGAKAYALVFLPILLLFAWRTRGRTEAAISALLALGVTGGLVGIFLIVGPAGVLAALQLEIDRPLHVESAGGALILAGHFLTGLPIHLALTHGSWNIVSAPAPIFATVQVGLVGLTLVAVWFWFWRTRPRPTALVLAVAACIATYVALGKVASPQYLTWLIPIVPLVRGKRGVAATAALGIALLFAADLYPHRYPDLVYRLDAGAALSLVLRDVATLAVLAFLVAPSWRRVASRRTPSERSIGTRRAVRRSSPRAIASRSVAELPATAQGS
jgi:hypothetical protein